MPENKNGPEAISQPMPDLDIVLNLDKLPHAGRHLAFNADEEQRAEIALQMNLKSVHAMSGTLFAERMARGIKVSGQLLAECEQPCVVTLQPVAQKIETSIDRLFLPKKLEKEEPGPGSETFVDLAGDDLPDYFEGGELDLSPLIYEILGMEADLYPRAPGVALDDVLEPEQAPATDEENPFAVLETLKKKLK